VYLNNNVIFPFRFVEKDLFENLDAEGRSLLKQILLLKKWVGISWTSFI
jgi:hypothetical protein